MTTRATLITCLLLLYAPSTHAWSWLNHVTIAQVAYEELSPSTRLYVDRDIVKCRGSTFHVSCSALLGRVTIRPN